jgi:hypothetical protein
MAMAAVFNGSLTNTFVPAASVSRVLSLEDGLQLSTERERREAHLKN